MAGYRDVRGVCDITEDGMGGFTMDSVYSGVINGERFVTDVFRLKSEVDAEGKKDCKEEIGGKEAQENKEGWNPKNFDFKAAIDGSSSKDRSNKMEPPANTQKNGEEKTVSKNMWENNAKEYMEKAIESLSDEQLDIIFDRHYADILKDVIRRFGNAAEKVKCIRLKELRNKDQRMTKDDLKDLVEELKKSHGDNCDCEDYFKGLIELYDSLSHFPLEFLEKVKLKIGKTEEWTYRREVKKATTEGTQEETKED